MRLLACDYHSIALCRTSNPRALTVVIERSSLYYMRLLPRSFVLRGTRANPDSSESLRILILAQRSSFVANCKMEDTPLIGRNSPKQSHWQPVFRFGLSCSRPEMTLTALVITEEDTEFCCAAPAAEQSLDLAASISRIASLQWVFRSTEWAPISLRPAHMRAISRKSQHCINPELIPVSKQMWPSCQAHPTWSV